MPSICWTWNVLDMDPTFIYEGSKNLDNTAGTVFFRKNYFSHAINLKTAAKVSVLARSANFLTRFTIIWIGFCSDAVCVWWLGAVCVWWA